MKIDELKPGVIVRGPILPEAVEVMTVGVEATRLGLAYEYDPYFSLSIARIDPLPHQLEAVGDAIELE